MVGWLIRFASQIAGGTAVAADYTTLVHRATGPWMTEALHVWRKRATAAVRALGAYDRAALKHPISAVPFTTVEELLDTTTTTSFLHRTTAQLREAVESTRCCVVLQRRLGDDDVLQIAWALLSRQQMQQRLQEMALARVGDVEHVEVGDQYPLPPFISA